MASRKKHKGLLITFEGIDGCGKSTQLDLTFKYLKARGKSVVRLREPGSTPSAERIRRLLLDKRVEIGDLAELLLYEAARAEVTEREIIPNLKKGRIVLCDRFFDSTTAYQGHGRKLDLKMVKALHRIAVSGHVPDLTLVFDVTLKVAAMRRGKNPDRLESQPTAFHRRVRQGFLKVAKAEPRRVKVIDGRPSAEVVFEQVRTYIDRKIGRP